jgi:hypothetical protein
MSLEKALNLEANAKLTLPGISAEFTLFRTAFEGFVYGELTGNSYDELGVFFPDTSADFLELLYVQRDATFTGGELEAEIGWRDRLGRPHREHQGGPRSCRV